MIIEDFKKLIDQQYAITVNLNNPKNSSLIIQETHPEAKLKQVEITGFAGSMTYAFKLDLDNQRICNYFARQAPKVHKACDGIIFTQLDDKNYIFLCELKSAKPDEEDCILKYKNSQLFLDYIIKILMEFYDLDQKIKFNYKYILFDTKKTDPKTPTKKQKIHTSPLKAPNGVELSVYRIHRLDKPLNIRHLEL